MSNYNKYISVSIDKNSMPIIIVFPVNINHRDMAFAMRKIGYRHCESAGFVDEFLQCYGESTTLRLKSKPEDTRILRTQLNIEDKKLEFDDGACSFCGKPDGACIC